MSGDIYATISIDIGLIAIGIIVGVCGLMFMLNKFPMGPRF